MSELGEELEEFAGKRGRGIITTILILVAAYIIASLVFSFWPFSSAAGVVQKVTSAESIIGNYQWYYDQKAAIDAQTANIETLTASDPKAPELAGMRMVLNNAIAEYNSRSKQITRNLWKASDLPYQIKLGGVK